MSLSSTFLYSFSIPKSPFSSSSSLPTSRYFAGIPFRRRAAALPFGSKTMMLFLGTGFTLALLGPESASAATQLQSSLLFNEPQNALSLPTWAIHVSSVVEWITAMALVWQYGEKSGNESWKGLSWGMVPLLGGAFCACTWHFFYNSESLEVLVAIQAMLTAIGNATMCIAAFRIYKSSQESSKNL
ncbi:ycf49-like protein [Benincasa hispida]|uniref:ycf49-like protein n=1 Tax=Benincasa hispida TaxID=102211 RepID=UPI00190131F9|nr:ycf49-like protein [Benincasa hispida]